MAQKVIKSQISKAIGLDPVLDPLGSSRFDFQISLAIGLDPVLDPLGSSNFKFQLILTEMPKLLLNYAPPATFTF
jgi:hypothetical protein